jgi:hypothetical protein
MVRDVIAVVLCCLLCVACAGSPKQSVRPWSRALGGSGDDSFNVVALTPSGDIVAAGSITSTDGDFFPAGTPVSAPSDGGSMIGVVELSPSGDTLWTRVFTANGWIGLNGAAVTPDGTIVLVGGGTATSTDLAPSGGSGGALITALSPDGGVLWGSLVGATGDVFSSVAVTSDGTIVAAGSTSLGQDTAGMPIVSTYAEAFSAAGDQVWTTPFDPYSVQPTVVAGPSGSAYTVYGVQQDPDGDSTGWTWTWATLGADGLVTSSTPLPNSGDAYYADFAATAYGTLVLLSVADDATSVTKVTSSGQAVWTTPVSTDANAVSTGIVLAADGSAIVVGQDGLADAQDYCPPLFDATVTSIGPGGAVAWTRTLGGSGYDWFRAVVIASDGDIVAAGFTSSQDGDFAPAKVTTPRCADFLGSALVARLAPDGTLG